MAMAVPLPRGLAPPAGTTHSWHPATFLPCSAPNPRRRSLVVGPLRAASTSQAEGIAEWLTSQGVDLSKAAVGPSGHLVSTRPVAKGETVLSVPETAWITKETALQSSMGPLVADLEPWLAVALFVLHERRNATSPWLPYLDSLPLTCDSPVTWLPEDLALLRGTQLLVAVESYQAYFSQRHQQLQAALFADNPDTFPADAFGYEAFLWAACTVRARAHSPLDGEDVAMVPLADLVSFVFVFFRSYAGVIDCSWLLGCAMRGMSSTLRICWPAVGKAAAAVVASHPRVALLRCRCTSPPPKKNRAGPCMYTHLTPSLCVCLRAVQTQHRRGAGAGVQWQLKQAGLFARGRSLAIEAARALGEGEGLAMDFGPLRTEGQVLLDHGAIDPATAVGTFALTLTLPESDRFYDDKLDVLEQGGLTAANEFILRSGSPPPDALLATLRLLNLGGADAFLLEGLFRNDVWETLQQPVSEENERAVFQSMVDGCLAALDGYPTSLDEDFAAVREAPAGSRAAVAGQVRLGEKEALDASLRFFEAGLERLKGMEFYAERRLKRLGLLDKDGRPTDWESFFDDGIA